MAGGKVSSSLALATHLVVFSVPGLDVDFGTILKGYVYGVCDQSRIFTYLGCSHFCYSQMTACAKSYHRAWH